MLLDSGIATIWRLETVSRPGEMPKGTYSREYYKSYYGEKTVGFARYWAAKAHDMQASLMIEIQRNGGINTADRCELDSYMDTGVSGFYKIVQVQHLNNEDGLPVTDLTLERIEAIDQS